jgi:hypothetical protein
MPNSLPDTMAGAPNPQAYVDNRDGTVTDTTTRLMWQQTIPATKVTWDEASAACGTLTLAGYDDWRLPSIIELISLIDYAAPSRPRIDQVAFPATPASDHWSSPQTSVVVSFHDGTVPNDGVSSAYYRCVR